MKLVDYLAKSKRYKELRRQLKEAKNDLKLNVEVFGIYGNSWDNAMKQTCIERSIELNKNIKFLEQELREIFKEAK